MQALNHKRYDWMAALLLGGIVLYGGWLYRNFAQDDAFITYRYARNIVTGYGFVYNLNEPLLGTTTPLYTLVLALAGKLSGQDIRLVSHLMSLFSLWISGYTLYYLGKNNGILASVSVALIFISNPLLMTAIGMETFFLLAIMLLALLSYVRQKFNLAGVLLGLLVLTRYETVIFAGILGVHYLVKRRQLPFWLVSTVAIFAAWMIFALYTFGHVIPRSAVSKLVEDEGFSFAVGAILWWRIYALQTEWYYALIPLALLGVYSTLRDKLRETAFVLILIWTVIYFGAAGFIAGTFTWYYGPLMPGFAILLVWGIKYLIRLLSQIRYFEHFGQRVEIAVFAIITVAVVILQLSSWSRGWVNYQNQIIDKRYVSYQTVSQWLNRHASDNISLAASEIGVLGYYTDDVRIVDLYALVTPDLIPWLTADRTELLNKTIELYTPNYLLIDEQELMEALESSSDYDPIEQFDNGAYILYKKK